MSLQISFGREASQRILTIKSFTLDESIKLELLSEIAEVLDENLSTSVDGNRVIFDMNSLKETLKKAYNQIERLENTSSFKESTVKTIDDLYNPKYYNENGLSPIEAFKMGLLSQEEYIGFLKGNIIKYSVRCDKKNLEEDMDKCKTYAEYLREELKSVK